MYCIYIMKQANGQIVINELTDFVSIHILNYFICSKCIIDIHH